MDMGFLPSVPDGIELGLPQKVEGTIKDPMILVAGLLGTTFSVAGALFQGNLVRERNWTIKDYEGSVGDAIIGVCVLTGISMIIMITAGTVIRGEPATDALVTAEPAVPMLMRFGDCAPILLFDPAQHVVGLAHAGWRGIVADTVGATIRTMREQVGCDPSNLWAGIGPTIGPCCYEIGPEVAGAVQASCPPGVDVTHQINGRTHLDLPGAAQAQLRAMGVAHTEHADICTVCRVDEFFSHRAERGRTGRFGVVIGLLA